MNLTFDQYREKIKKLNGTNVIVVNEKKEILTFKSNYGNKTIMLPGGSLERNELPHHAGQSECEEETGLYPENSSMQLICILMQRVPGIPDVRGYNFLYLSNKVQGTIWESNEGEMPKYLSVKEVFERRAEFGTSYLKMIAHYLLWLEHPVVSVKRLSDPVSVMVEGELITV
jgi:ADP-ribose pyrophosphatase YjhB (NUDIX family)